MQTAGSDALILERPASAPATVGLGFGLEDVNEITPVPFLLQSAVAIVRSFCICCGSLWLTTMVFRLGLGFLVPDFEYFGCWALDALDSHTHELF